MASTLSSSHPVPRHCGRLDLNSIRAFVLSVDRHIHRFLSDANTWESLKLKCDSHLKIQKQEFFEFSEQSVLSNLYWGIENVEIAMRAKFPEKKSAHLTSSEQMLQIPALLDEVGATGGVSNAYLICCADFYLSLVRKLQRDEWQMTLHFLQALLVSPRHVRMEFAPEIWEGLYVSQIMGCQRKVQSGSPTELGEDAIDEAMGQLVRRYKDWIMYYRVVLYGETPRWVHGRGAASTCYVGSSDSVRGKSGSTTNLDRGEQKNALPVIPDADLKRPLKLQLDIKKGKNGTSSSILYKGEEPEYTNMDDGTSRHIKSKEVNHWDIKKSSHIKCLHDMLKNSQSDISVSIYSGSDMEERMHNCGTSATTSDKSGVLASQIGEGNFQANCSITLPECAIPSSLEAFGCSMHEEAYELNSSSFFSSRSNSSDNDLNLSILNLKDADSCSFRNLCFEEMARMQNSPSDDFICSKHLSPTFNQEDSFGRKKLDGNLSEVFLHLENNSHIEILRKFEKAVSA